jgi:hypothetical protein
LTMEGKTARRQVRGSKVPWRTMQIRKGNQKRDATEYRSAFWDQQSKAPAKYLMKIGPVAQRPTAPRQAPVAAMSIRPSLFELFMQTT